MIKLNNKLYYYEELFEQQKCCSESDHIVLLNDGLNICNILSSLSHVLSD